MDSFLQGFNVTVIAYGQTGSGKTFTMGNSIAASAMIASRLLFQPPGAAPWTGNDVAPSLPVDTVQESEGLIPRFLHQLFAQLKETESAGGDHVSVSFLEIYGEEIHDLLSEHARQQQDDGSQSLQLRENKAGVWVQGLTEVKVSNRRDALEQMRIGSLRRVTGSTEMNEHSSRSHAVYTVKIVRRINRRESLGGKAASTLKAPTTASLVNGKRRVNGRRLSFDEANGSDADAADATIVSKLTFVDLAGSERLKKTHAEGNRMKEGIQINVGLLALGNVINALGDKKSGSNLQTHVPYRSSKLTRLLQDALGGNSRTLFIACVSPAGANSNETLNTLQYANRAKNIQNKAVKNIDSRSAELLGLKAFNELLRRELVKARFMQAAGVDPSQIEAMVDMMLKDPAVLAYLKRLEQIAASSGVEAYGSDIRDETEKNQALLSRLSAHLSSMLSDRENGGDGRQQVEFDDVDAMSDGESVVMMEDKVGEVLEDLSPFSLAQLCQTLEVISTSLEIQSIWSLAARKSSSIESKVSRQDVKIRQKKTIADALEEALARMATWVAASSDDDPSENERTRQMNACQNKLSEIKSNITKLAEEKSIYLQELQDHSSRTKRQVLLKQDTIDQLRKTSQQLNSEANTNPLDILIRSSEIKNRFKIRELVDVSHFLEDGEKTMAEYLDEEIDAIAHLPSLFAKSDCPIASSEEIFLSLRDELQNTLDFEDLEASLSKELRNRARIVQGLTNGWLSCQERDGFLNENEFLSANEQKLKQCEGNIRYLSETIRSQSKQEKHLATMVESLASLDTAKRAVFPKAANAG
uniref:Kinesin-like protein n=1 Tax=Globisporangium ultimum (strain ATCC 200006 / CBS 805.95 / DAOM BR144) TaxID=431595 RepID=K3X0N0_GLOUD